MSGLIQKPKNSNFLQPTKYQMSFSDISDAIFFCQKVNLPGVGLGVINYPTPNLNLYAAGVNITYEPLDISFIVNEDLSTWLSVHDWIRSITTDSTIRTKRKSQATLTVLNNLNNPVMRFKFINIFPVSVSTLDFDTTLSAEDHVTATATFRFDYFEHEPIV